MEEQAKQIAELLKLLANEHRLLILCALIRGRLTVGDIHKYSPNIPLPPFRSIASAENAGILSSQKQGMHVVYWIEDERVMVLMEAIKDQYCKDPGKESRAI